MSHRLFRSLGCLWLSLAAACSTQTRQERSAPPPAPGPGPAGPAPAPGPAAPGPAPATPGAPPVVPPIAPPPPLAPKPSGRSVMLQLFNWRFRDVAAAVPAIAAQGFNFIYVSPPEKSNSSTEWWARYQPVDFGTIDSPLGDEADLKAMIAAAHAAGLEVVIDTVLNHMADESPYSDTLSYPQFSARDFHPKMTITDYNDPYQLQHGWLGGDLPDLDTSSPYVRQVAKAYLQKLLGLGADGFRFDAAKHIEPDFFREVLGVVPPGAEVFGEIISDDPTQLFPDYTPYMSAYDFPLTATMISAFAMGGDLRTLIDPASQGHALAPTRAVSWVVNHDTYLAQYGGFSFGAKVDRQLATAYILGRQEGLPMLFATYPDDHGAGAGDFPLLQSPDVRAGILFHNLSLGAADRWIGSDANWLALARGSQGLAAINKAAAAQALDSIDTGLDDGAYVDLRTGQTYQARGGRIAGLQIGPQSALFLFRTAP